MPFPRSFCFLLSAILYALPAWSHPMPYSVLILDAQPNGLSAELKLPLKEMQAAVPFDVVNHTETLIRDQRQAIADYLLAHIHPQTEDGKAWTVTVGDLRLDSTQQEATGMYSELTVQLYLRPPEQSTARRFILYYDAIVHQLVTHKILVSVRQDFDNGKIGGPETEVGFLYMDPAANTVAPLAINLETGSVWKGFNSMVRLGMQHIAEGTDHLLFLLVLLLSAPLVATRHRWTGTGSTKYSLLRLLKIITAFTIGHSCTLVISAAGLFRLPGQMVEVLIAFSILVTAVHAVRPIFPDREIYVATGFGLIHGLAFAAVLTNLQLETGRMVLSVLGFNIGIEIMQLYVVLLTFPWLLILSTMPAYKWVRIIGATLAALAALGWITERIFLAPNTLSVLVQNMADHGKYLVLLLMVIAIVNLLLQPKQITKSSEDKEYQQ